MNKIRPRQPSKKTLPRISKPPELHLTPQQTSLIQNVHRDYAEIILEKELGGGFSGTRVFLVLPVKPGGARAAQVVTKIGRAEALRREYDNYKKQVAPSLPFSATQVSEHYEQGTQAALNYVFAGGETLGQTASLEEYYHSHTAQEVIEMLTGLLDKALGTIWYGQDHSLNCSFRMEYGRHLPRDLEKTVQIVFPSLSPAGGDHIQIPGLAGTYPHPLHLYPRLLDQVLQGRRSLVHGDLHLRNVLVDENGKGWLIDFAKVKERHNLFDFIKLETSLRLWALAAEYGAFSLNEYAQFERALNTTVLSQNSPPPANPTLTKAYQVIRAIREIAQNYMCNPRNFKQEYLPALFLYSLALMKYYPTNGPAPTQLVFLTACVAGEALLEGNLPTDKIAPCQADAPSASARKSPRTKQPGKPARNPSGRSKSDSSITVGDIDASVIAIGHGARVNHK